MAEAGEGSSIQTSPVVPEANPSFGSRIKNKVAQIGRRHFGRNEEKHKVSKNPEIQGRVEEKKTSLKNDGLDEDTANKIARQKIADELRIERLREEARSAYEDPTTGVRSKRWLLEQIPLRAAAAERSSSPLYAIFMDVDDFKPFNSYYDHQVGDEVLKIMSELPVREDEPVARFGGDEFVQLVNRTITEEDIRKVIDRYQKIFIEASRIRLSNCPVQKGKDPENAPREVTLSFGVAKYEGEKPEDFIKKASVAVLQSKEQGKKIALIAEKSHSGELTLRNLGEINE